MVMRINMSKATTRILVIDGMRHQRPTMLGNSLGCSHSHMQLGVGDRCFLITSSTTGTEKWCRILVAIHHSLSASGKLNPAVSMRTLMLSHANREE